VVTGVTYRNKRTCFQGTRFGGSSLKTAGGLEEIRAKRGEKLHCPAREGSVGLLLPGGVDVLRGLGCETPASQGGHVALDCFKRKGSFSLGTQKPYEEQEGLSRRPPLVRLDWDCKVTGEYEKATQAGTA